MNNDNIQLAGSRKVDNTQFIKVYKTLFTNDKYKDIPPRALILYSYYLSLYLTTTLTDENGSYIIISDSKVSSVLSISETMTVQYRKILAVAGLLTIKRSTRALLIYVHLPYAINDIRVTAKQLASESFYMLPFSLLDKKQYPLLDCEAALLYAYFKNQLEMSADMGHRDAQGIYVPYDEDRILANLSFHYKLSRKRLSLLEKSHLIVRKKLVGYNSLIYLYNPLDYLEGRKGLMLAGSAPHEILRNIRQTTGLSQRAYVDSLNGFLDNPPTLSAYKRYETGDRRVPPSLLESLYEHFMGEPISHGNPENTDFPKSAPVTRKDETGEVIRDQNDRFGKSEHVTVRDHMGHYDDSPETTDNPDIFNEILKESESFMSRNEPMIDNGEDSLAVSPASIEDVTDRAHPAYEGVTARDDLAVTDSSPCPSPDETLSAVDNLEGFYLDKSIKDNKLIKGRLDGLLYSDEDSLFPLLEKLHTFDEVDAYMDVMKRVVRKLDREASEEEKKAISRDVLLDCYLRMNDACPDFVTINHQVAYLAKAVINDVRLMKDII